MRGGPRYEGSRTGSVRDLRDDARVTETASRLLELLSLLQTHRDWPGAELAGRLEVSDRTLRRDVDRLRDLGYPVQACAASPAATGSGRRRDAAAAARRRGGGRDRGRPAGGGRRRR